MEQPRTLNVDITITVCLSSFIAAELGSLAAYGGSLADRDSGYRPARVASRE